MKHVILSTNLNEDYMFFAPLVSQMWLKLGFTPHTFLIGKKEVWESHAKGSIVLQELRTPTYFLDEVSGYRTSTVAQVSRLLGATLPVDDNEMLMTTDTDMLPMNQAFFDQAGPELSIFYYNAYAHEANPHFPICYLSAPKRMWRTFTGNLERQPLLEFILNHLEHDAHHWTAWNFDEAWISRRIAEADGGTYSWTSPTIEKATKIMRDQGGGMVVRRIDRARGENPPPDKVDDVHSWRPGYAEHWPEVWTCFRHVCPDLASWAAMYRNVYVTTSL